jgi:hypothetical protein
MAADEMGTTLRASAWMAGLQDPASSGGELVWCIDGYLLLLGMGGRYRGGVARAYCGFIAAVLVVKIVASAVYLSTNPLDPAHWSMLLCVAFWNVVGLEVGVPARPCFLIHFLCDRGGVSGLVPRLPVFGALARLAGS